VTVDYLRRLQPTRAEPSGAARVDLGSRFAPVRTSVAPGLSPDGPWLDSPAPASEVTGADRPGPAAGRSPPPIAAPGSASRADAAAEPDLLHVPRHRQAAASPHASAALADPGQSAAADGSTPVPRRPPHRAATPAPQRAQPDAAAAPSLRAVALPSAIDAHPGAWPAARRPPPAAEPAAPTHPLRPASLPAPQAAAAPPVIHVTIDRIDVRMPPAAAPAGPARRARPPAAAPSLAEYLRGHAATPGPR
jgi:hypothetical protein